jgi:hypothetical protein
MSADDLDALEWSLEAHRRQADVASGSGYIELGRRLPGHSEQAAVGNVPNFD